MIGLLILNRSLFASRLTEFSNSSKNWRSERKIGTDASEQANKGSLYVQKEVFCIALPGVLGHPLATFSNGFFNSTR